MAKKRKGGEAPVEDTNPEQESIPMSNTQEVVIQGRTFHAPAPYAEGHVCSQTEAHTLNQTLAENLRNNFSARMKKAAENGQTLTEDDFAEYAATYSFGVRTARIVRDPIAAEERKLAAATVRNKLAEKGIKPKEVPEDTFEAYVNMAVETGKFRALAERNVRERQELKDISLDIG